MELPESVFTDSISTLDYFKQKENQFYSDITCEFPKLTEEEYDLLFNNSKLTSIYRDGIDIFGKYGYYIQRITPKNSTDVMDLTSTSNPKHKLSQMLDNSDINKN